jgi:hypothetical protein
MNRLASAKSLYLRQHADNPVDWHPWGEEPFAKAKAEDKPVFLSIGYSSCHWCHVMERESFEDEEVAALLNSSFVAVKVDREERPDLDLYYMEVCRTLTGGGGWPLTVILTPDREPFFAGTYFPKTSRFGRPGLVELLPRLGEAWRSRRDEIGKASAEIRKSAEREAGSGGGGDLDPGVLRAALDHFADAFDPRYGGFGDAPKFPAPHNLLFLLRAWKRTGDERALRMAVETLVRMRRGGIFDHLGFGFHRYSTDARWLVPHFEKMITDQGMLLLAYAEAFQATGNPLFRSTAGEIAEYARREMTYEGGAFFAAEDADAAGEEGSYYLWTEDEIRNALPAGEADFVLGHFLVQSRGNFDDRERPGSGRNVLHEDAAPGDFEPAGGISETPAASRLSEVRSALLRFRETRPRPVKDTKIAADGNGLMIAGLSKASVSAAEPRLAAAAARAADFVLRRMRMSDGRLFHVFAEGEAFVPGFLDDYAFFIWGLIELYEATFEAGRLAAAVDLARRAVEQFWDRARGGFFFTAEGASDIPLRPKSAYDGAYPSGNAVMMDNLLRLGRMTGDIGFEDLARKTGAAFSARIAASPTAFAHWLSALVFAIGPGREVVVAGKAEAADSKALLEAAGSLYDPNRIVLFRPSGPSSADLEGLAPFVKGMKPAGGRAAAYVCSNDSCRAPVTDPEDLLRILRDSGSAPRKDPVRR